MNIYSYNQILTLLLQGMYSEKPPCWSLVLHPDFPQLLFDSSLKSGKGHEPFDHLLYEQQEEILHGILFTEQ